MKQASNIENPVRTRKGLTMMSIFVFLFCGLCGCVDELDPMVPHTWIGFDVTKGFVIKQWRDDRLIAVESNHPLVSQVKRLELERTNRCGEVRFAVIGDSRAAYEKLGFSVFWRPMLEEITRQEPQLVLHVGDLVKNGRSANEWRQFIQTMPQYPPLIAVRGNHDRGPYFYEWGIGVSEVFKLDYGAVRIYGLDTEGGAEQVRERLVDLAELLARPTSRWKVVLLHRPIWSQGLHGSDELGLNTIMTELFERHGVHLVLAGHDHNYERFCPTIGVADNRICHHQTKAPTYVVTGGGATMPNPLPTVWRRFKNQTAKTLAKTSASYSGSLHYVRLDVTSRRMTFTARRAQVGNLLPAGVFDQLHWTKENPECP